jgi:hypothetical protein
VLRDNDSATCTGVVEVVDSASAVPELPPPDQLTRQVTVARSSYTPPGWLRDGAV